ncbi:type IV toxin-antitoxin system AbiEi family antitoxin domain-containing protein [Agromyces lapidis]
MNLAATPPPSVVSILRGGGVIRSSGLASAGLDHRRIADGVRRGELTMIRRGWFAVPPVDHDVIRAVRVGGALTAGSVAKLHGLWTLDDERLHVRVPSTASRLRSPDDARARLDADVHGVCLHYRPAGGPRSTGDRLGRDGLIRSLAEMFRCAGTVPAMVALESALNRGVLPMQALAMIGALAPAWAGRPIELASPLSDSGLETIARLLFHRVRVPVRTQVRLGDVRRVDILVGDRLVIELDGRGFHSGDDFDRDRRQDLELSLRGYLVVRLSYRMVIEDWDETHRRVLDLVSRGLHRWGRAARELT